MERIRLIEEWRTVPGFPDYDVSDWGRIKSWRGIQGKRRLTPKILKPYFLKSRSNSGWESYEIGLYRPYTGERQKWNGYTSFSVGRLVLLAFVGPLPQGEVCRHLDDDVTHNRLNNLRYGTPLENRADRVRNSKLASRG